MISRSPEDQKKILSSRGLKNTRSRNKILSILENLETPQTAEEIFLQIRSSDKNVNSSSTCLSTVYRTIEKLTATGFLIKTGLFEDRKFRYEINRNQHMHHAVCLICHKMILVSGCPFDEIENSLKSNDGFTIAKHSLEIYGYCRDCRP